MGLFNFIGNVTSAAVKVVLTPVAVVADVAVKVVTNENPELAEGCIKSASKDMQDAVDEILP